MKVKEVTNPEEQLALLRVIIDNTWGAIKQQADAHARQRAEQPTPRPKKGATSLKPAPYAPKPPALPKPKAAYPPKPQPIMKSTIGKAISKPTQVGVNTIKPSKNNFPNVSLTNLEKDEAMNLPRGVLPKPL